MELTRNGTRTRVRASQLLRDGGPIQVQSGIKLGQAELDGHLGPGPNTAQLETDPCSFTVNLNRTTLAMKSLPSSATARP